MEAATGARRMGWALIVGSAAVVIGFNLTGTSETLLPSALVLVLLGSTGILLRNPGTRVVAVSNGALMVIAGLTWVEDGPDRAALLGTMLAGFVVMGFVMWVVRVAGTVAIARYLRLFEENPVALIEQDWTGVAKAAAELGFEDLDELRSHLQSHPDLVADLADALNPLGIKLMVYTASDLGWGDLETRKALGMTSHHNDHRLGLREKGIPNDFQKNREGQIEYLKNWIDQYPIISIEARSSRLPIKR